MTETLFETTSRKKDRPRLITSSEVLAALRKKYADNAAYAFFTEVGNATGTRCNRHADAMVMSLWPSRGLEVLGFEVKVSRGDWKRELENPGKADAIALYCDRWYLVVGDENIVQDGELPPTWGLMVPAKEGTLRCKVEPKPNEFLKPLDRPFVAAVLRCAQAQLTGEAQLSKLRAELYTQARKDADTMAQRSVERELAYYAELKKRVATFEKASGVQIDEWHGGEKIGEAVRMVMAGMASRQLDQLRHLKRSAENIIASIETELAVHANLKAEEVQL